MNLNKEEIKKEYLKKNNIDIIQIKKDKIKIKNKLKKLLLINYPCSFYLCKSDSVLYLVSTTIDFDIVILAKSSKNSFEEQMQDIFSNYEFFKKNEAGSFDLFPGFKNSIYGFSNENNIILGNSTTVIEF